MMLIKSLDLGSKYDLSFVTYVHRNKLCLYLFVNAGAKWWDRGTSVSSLEIHLYWDLHEYFIVVQFLFFFLFEQIPKQFRFRAYNLKRSNSLPQLAFKYHGVFSFAGCSQTWNKNHALPAHIHTRVIFESQYRCSAAQAKVSSVPLHHWGLVTLAVEPHLDPL